MVLLKLTIAGFLIGLSAMASIALGDSSSRPNVLLIAVDDLRPELGCYGVEEIQTPNLDQLASESILFERAYCQQAVCNPSRVSMLTGMRPDSTKVWDLVTQFRKVTSDLITLPQYFKQNGYTALGYGKIFHNPWPDNQSWSEPHRWPAGRRLWSQEARDELLAVKTQLRNEGLPDRQVNRLRATAVEQVDLRDDEHIDGAIAQQAIDSLSDLAKQSGPFFLAAGFVRPHLPFVVPRQYWDQYDRNQISLALNPHPPGNAPSFALNTMYELRDYHDFRTTPLPSDRSLTESQQRELKHGYYASVSFVDAQIGKLLGKLESLGLRENTIVVLWGDHGWKLGEHRSWCKQTNYEIDTRVPLMISVPSVKKRDQRIVGKTAAIVESIDLYPTLCDLVGLPVPDQSEGRILTALLENPDLEWDHPAVSQFPRRDASGGLMGYALRTDRYRYIEWLNRQTCETVATELYDHQNNDYENDNLIDVAADPLVVSTLKKHLWSTIPRPLAGDLVKPIPVIDPESTERTEMTWRNLRDHPVEIFLLQPKAERALKGTVQPDSILVIEAIRGQVYQAGDQGRHIEAVRDRQLNRLLPRIESSDQNIDNAGKN